MDNFSEENKPEMGASAGAPQDKTIHIKINKKSAIKYGGIAVAVIAVLVVGFLVKGLFIAAMVNGSPIGRLAVISELEKVSGKNALDALITRKLVESAAQKAGVTVSADEVAAEIKKIDDRLKEQGQALATALVAANMKQADLEKQIIDQKTIEKLVADKISVTAEEVAQYIKDYKVPVTKGQEVETNSQIQEQLKQQKLSDASSALIESLRSAATIRYFVNYAK